MKKKGKGKPRGMNYADVLKARRDRLQLAIDEAALLNVEQSMQLSLADGGQPARCLRLRSGAPAEVFRCVSGELGYAFEKLRLRAEDVSRMDIRYYGKLKID